MFFIKVSSSVSISQPFFSPFVRISSSTGGAAFSTNTSRRRRSLVVSPEGKRGSMFLPSVALIAAPSFYQGFTSAFHSFPSYSRNIRHKNYIPQRTTRDARFGSLGILGADGRDKAIQNAEYKPTLKMCDSKIAIIGASPRHMPSNLDYVWWLQIKR